MPENNLIKVFDIFGERYLRQFGDRMPRNHRKAFKDISECRTAAHGMIEKACESCGEITYSYGACRNRVCPRCNSAKNFDWVRSICERFPNTPYYHIVFTVPDQLRYLARRNQKVFYSHLLAAVNNTLRAFSKSDEWVHGKTGYMCVLHTWDSRINIHPHVHVLFMGGYLNSTDNWVELSGTKVFPNEAMSCRFKTVLLKSLREYFQENIPSSIWKTKWIVYTKKAETGESHVIGYLGAYIKRVAISASRVVGMDDERVTFKYRHYAARHEIEMKDMVVTGQEFIRRYMQHVLPRHFVRVRYYGLFHAAHRKKIEEIKKINGELQLAEREAAKVASAGTKKCTTCQKPFLFVMAFFPTRSMPHNDLRENSRGNFYIDKTSVETGKDACNQSLHQDAGPPIASCSRAPALRALSRSQLAATGFAGALMQSGQNAVLPRW